MIDSFRTSLNSAREAQRISRRDLLRRGIGLGGLAFLDLLRRDLPEFGSAQDSIGVHFAPRAKRVIWLFMAGAPSQFELFGPKVQLHKAFSHRWILFKTT